MQMIQSRDLTVKFIVIEADIVKRHARIMSRWVCTKCHKVFNAKTSPSKKIGKCDNCDTILTKRRSDQNENEIKKRLESYDALLTPIIKTLEEWGITVEKLDGKPIVRLMLPSL